MEIFRSSEELEVIASIIVCIYVVSSPGTKFVVTKIKRNDVDMPAWARDGLNKNLDARG